MLIILSGLPGVGKTTLARDLAAKLNAFHIRIDSIEQVLRDGGVSAHALYDEGYRIGYAVAKDNLLVGSTVIADSVNPLEITRQAWMDVARHAQAEFVEIEILCSDLDQHRSRVERRATDISGLRLPTWQDVVARVYEPWQREHIVIDTSHATVAQSVAAVLAHLKMP